MVYKTVAENLNGIRRIPRLVWGYNIKMDARGPVSLEYRCNSPRDVTAVFRTVYQIDIHYALQLFSDIA
jgi:hypothetical protein